MKTIQITDIAENEAIIRACQICFVAMCDSQGLPYVVPMNFVYHNQTLYFHSAPQGKHLDILAHQPQVCVSFCAEATLVYQHQQVACSYRMQSKSVLCKGKVGFIDSLAEKETILNKLMKNFIGHDFKYSLPALKNVKVWKMPIDEITGKAFGVPHQKP